jgi:hypothetical protein
MPDDHTVTGSAEAHKIIMCAVGSTPALLGNTSGTVKSRSTQSNIAKGNPFSPESKVPIMAES